MKISVHKCTFLFQSLTILLTGVTSQDCLSQIKNSNSDSLYKSKYHITFVKQIPSQELKKRSQKVIDFAVGAKNIELSKPISILKLNENSILIIDQVGQSILEYNMRNDKMDIFFDDEEKVFPSLVDICTNDKNQLFFTDSRLNQVFKYDVIQKECKKFNIEKEFFQPTGIAYSSIKNEVWVTETKAHKISIFDESGYFLRELGGRGTDPGKFNYPTFIWIDDSGLIYIVDSLNFRLQIFDADGNLVSVFGQNGNASGYFARPKGVATDSFDNIYIVDALFNTVQIFDRSGNFLHQFGSQGRGEGEFWLPTGIFIDNDNLIYVADSFNSRIQVFQLVINE